MKDFAKERQRLDEAVRQTFLDEIGALRAENNRLKERIERQDRLLAAYATKDEKILGAFREMGVL